MEYLIHICQAGILLCMAILIYTFAGYPLLLGILSRFFKKPVHKSEGYLPEVNVLISAYNEEKYIADCIRSVYTNDYPPEKISVLVGDDGSSDGTPDIIRSLRQEYPSIRFFAFGRKGKNAVLNELLAHAGAGLVVFTDADSRVTKGSLRRLTEVFYDESVGAAIGRQTFLHSANNSSSEGESMYYKYEAFLRREESAIGSVLSGFGAFYAVRRELLSSLPNNRVCDDFLPLLRVAVRRKRIINVPEASIIEVRDKEMVYQFPRIIRFTAGGLASLRETPELLSPSSGWVAFILWSHKIFRWFAPVFLLSMLVFSLLALAGPLGKISLLMFFVLLLCAGLGWLSERIGFGLRFFRLSYFFVAMNVSMLIGIIRFFGKAPTSQWEKAVA